MRTKASNRRTLTAVALFALALMALLPAAAFALGTAANTDINNKATINFQVNSIAQTPIESSPTGNSTPGVGSGTNTTFKVDRKVDMTITANDAACIATYPGSTGSASEVLRFTVTNTGNATQDFSAAYAALGGNTLTGETVTIYVDSNANGTFEPATDTATYIDELAADASRVVFLAVSSIPGAATNGQNAGYTITATARDGGGVGAQGAVSTATAGADTPGAVDTVLADDPGGGNGQESVNTNCGFTVSAAVLTITKTHSVISDPINLAVNPKAIPGATIEYTITIANAAGAATATSIAVSDAIDANTTFVAAGYGAGTGIQVTAPNLYGGAATALTNAADADEGSIAGATVSVSGITLTAGQSATVNFRVTIN